MPLIKASGYNVSDDKWHKKLRMGTPRQREAEVAEWQTRRTQNPVPARGCGFKSHLRYCLKNTRFFEFSAVLTNG